MARDADAVSPALPAVLSTTHTRAVRLRYSYRTMMLSRMGLYRTRTRTITIYDYHYEYEAGIPKNGLELAYVRCD